MHNTLKPVARPARKGAGLPVPPSALFGWRRRALGVAPVQTDKVASATLATLCALLGKDLT